MNPSIILVNGEIRSSEEPVLSSFNRSFRYGDGLFETMYWSDGRLWFANDHVARLNEGLGVLEMTLEKCGDTAYWTEQVKLLTARAGLERARIRLQVYRNEGGLYLPTEYAASWIMEAGLLPEVLVREKRRVMVLDAQVDSGPLSHLKTCNRLPQVWAAVKTSKGGYDDAILLNGKGRVAEAISSNLFLVCGNRLVTPAIGEGCVAGVMRKQVLVWGKELGMETEERGVVPDELYDADEIFLTNAISGIVSVRTLVNRSYRATKADLIRQHGLSNR
ncbi:MAG: aminotransferase class IV [Flavobacteriales bacterium]|nr:aminotransferase class IV [Flavobacteriales bacterium]